MRIRKKILITISVVSVLVFSITYLIGFKLFLPSFLTLENQETEKRVTQLANVLSKDLSNLNEKASDWSRWDDTYQFVQDHNEEYILANMMNETFDALKVNFMIFVDSGGQIVYSKNYDFSKMSYLPDFEDICSAIMIVPDFWNFSHKENEMKGIFFLANESIFLVAKPILTSFSEGPPSGTLIIGKYLNLAELNSLSEIIGYTVSISNITNVNQVKFGTALNSSNDTVIFTDPLNENMFAGYLLLKDNISNSVVLLQIDITRDIY
ncbi:MAG: hypothetical protein GX638_11420, partial [Crenarchaeota archaeon]|nr:hypothetical protein [Thermoproteota archaeon]